MSVPRVHMTLGWRMVLAASTASAAGCFGDTAARETSWHGTIDTLDTGTLIVRNPDAGVWDSITAWRLEEDLLIGSLEGSGPEAFGEIAALDVDRHGRIYVLERQAQEIRVFDSAGTYLRTIGAEGEGPGELTGAFGLAVDGFDRLWVPDAGNARITVFDSAGLVAADHQRSLGVVNPFIGGVDTSGTYWDVAPYFDDPRVHFYFVQLDSITGVFDSVPPVVYTPIVERVPRSVFLLRPRLTLEFDPSGYIWFGSTGDSRLIQRSLLGDTVRIIEWNSRRVPVSPAEREVIHAEMQELPFPVDPALIPALKPAFNRIVIGDEGHIFVSVPGTAGEEGKLVDVFRPDGLYLGRLTSPVALEWMIPPRFTASHMLGVTLDELGVAYVVRCRIVSLDSGVDDAPQGMRPNRRLQLAWWGRESKTSNPVARS